MANVLVFGHQNPDNDAIMSAVVLSQLLNQVEYAGNTYEAWPSPPSCSPTPASPSPA